MQFEIKNITRSQNDLMRAIGYMPAYFQPGAASSRGEPRPETGREFSIVRQLTGTDYPRFHLYIKEIASATPRNDGTGKTLIFNLHLDQKKPSYEGARGHSGEYDGEIIESEAERIKSLLK